MDDSYSGETLPVKKHVTIEESEYSFGPATFLSYLRFENGRLKRIDGGGFGFQRSSGKAHALIPSPIHVKIWGHLFP